MAAEIVWRLLQLFFRRLQLLDRRANARVRFHLRSARGSALHAGRCLRVRAVRRCDGEEQDGNGADEET